MNKKTKLIWVTPEAEKLIAYCARVSSPHQDNPEYAKLISYCIKHNHWSILEQANMCVEINTSRAISAQILRHRSFSFQEFSQRYAAVNSVESYPARRQDKKNRQNSLDDMSEEEKKWFADAQDKVADVSQSLYDEALSKGIAKEQARFLLPMASSTKMYMNGTLRSWVHFINVRTDPTTQLEHRELAEEIKQIFILEFPTISEALGWK